MPASNHAEFRHLRSGSLNIPSQNGRANGIMNTMPGQQKFDGPRSPPNTSHVPCKFYRQGACQAGNACPFSHDLTNAAENVCKYFAKGNCKFGPKCANIHVLPDGRRINYSKGGVTIGAAPINLGSRVNPNTYHHPSNSALTNSFMRADGVPPPYGSNSPYVPNDDRYQHQNHHLGRQPSMENCLPTIDTTYSSNPASVYGSPRDDESTRFGLGLSPINVKGLSVLDAPLPASFDSNGISHAARYGPWPSSVPSKFGLESPSASLSAAKDSRTSETLKLLHTSAFGSSEHLSNQDGLMTGSSPPVHLSDEHFGKRTMHSASQRFAKPRVLSASMPKVVDRDWEAEFLFLEEDYVPSSLANDVLTPQEKARRGSVRLTDEPSSSSGIPPTGAGLDVPSTSLPKFGSLGSSVAPGSAASPSRWGPLFQRHREEEAELGHGHGLPAGTPAKSMKHAVSAFGHVGSPLRNSSLAVDAERNGLSRVSGGSTGVQQRSDRSGSGSQSLSVLTQQLQRTKLGEDGSGGSSPRLHPNSARSTSGGPLPTLGSIGKERVDRDRGLERHVSSGSIGSSGRFTTPIDEEDSSFVFSMEDEDESTQSPLRSRKRISGGLGAGGWTYAGAVAAANKGINGNSKGREPSGIAEAVGSR